MIEITIVKPDDFHLHLREGRLMPRLAAVSGRHFARALLMPNLKKPLATAKRINRYCRTVRKSGLLPLAVFYLSCDLAPDDLDILYKDADVVAGKLYPSGTTHAAGIGDPGAIYPLIERMEELDIVLCVHGESAGESVFDREHDFLPVLREIHRKFPKLRIVMEHISDRRTLRFLQNETDENVAGTITAHHLLFTADDMLNPRMKPELFCKPLLRFKADRDALQKAVFGGGKRLFFGSDSAPHPRSAKRDSAAPGCFSSPAALPLLCELFFQNGTLDRLEPFVSRFGAAFYRLPQNSETISLRRFDARLPRRNAVLGMKTIPGDIYWKVENRD